MALAGALLLALPGLRTISQAAPSPSCADLPSLGEAAACGVFEVGTGVLKIKSNRTVNANLCVSAGGKASIKSGNTVNGTLYNATPCHPAVCGPGVKDPISGGIVQKDLSRAVADAISFSQALAALPVTQTIKPTMENASFTITGSGGINVITTPGKIDLKTAAQTITLVGNKDDVFIFNIYQPITMAGGGNKIILQGGVKPENVIWHIPVASHDVEIDDNSSTVGMFLNPYGKIKILGDGSSTHTGPFIGGTDIEVKASVNVTGPFFAGCETKCASPEISGLSPAGVNIERPAVAHDRKSGNFYYAYFDAATWEGHLEALRLATDGTIIDSLGDPAVDPSTKLLLPDRVPYWEAGEELKTNTSRTIYTTKSGSRVPFNATNVSAADLTLQPGDEVKYSNYPDSGVDTLAELHTAVIDYVHGMDAFDENGDLSRTDLRSFMLGDIFHSNPLLIGSPTTLMRREEGFAGFRAAYKDRDWVLYAGSNDGMLHAFDAGVPWDGIDPSSYDPGTGAELFGYVPGLLLPKIKLTPINTFRATFYVDGPISAADAWLGDLNASGGKDADEWATVLITAFRDGGPGYLALDVTDPSASTIGDHGPYPKLLWEFTHPKLGKSWSQAIITRVKVRGSLGTGDLCGKNDGDGDCREQWVAIFGGGYEQQGDPNAENYVADPASASWSNRSKAIFMVALDTGQLLASVEFDATGAKGPAGMKYSIASTPAVLSLDTDGFADVVYVGDLGGQLWKWDVSRVGEDTVGDSRIDNWSAGVFFRVAPANMGSGKLHYRSMYAPPAAAFSSGALTLAFGTGERQDLTYLGDESRDDNNRFYVVPDYHPTGSLAFGSPKTESDLVNVTSAFSSGGSAGFYFTAEEGEKFFTEPTVFAKHVLATSYRPDGPPSCGPGTAFLYAFRMAGGAGHFVAGETPLQARRTVVGSGASSTPGVSVAVDPDDDVITITTSEGEVVNIKPPLRTDNIFVIYWRQMF